MTEKEISDRWVADKPIFSAWAETVRTEICAGIAARGPVDAFLKVEPQLRLKDPKSLIDKALYRAKPYSNPYDEITDKAGVRFVVLLTTQIDKIEEIIQNGKLWTASKDKDYEAERTLDPFTFRYQSIHYVLRAAEDLPHGSLLVPRGTPCEVQVRTLLQHAHSELTHDSIYKGRRAAPPDVQRIVAKSMALIEVADDFFERVTADLTRANTPIRGTLETLMSVYIGAVGRAGETQKSNLLLLEAFQEHIPDDLDRRLRIFLEERDFVATRVVERAPQQHLYRQPTILLVYYLAETAPSVTKAAWPLTLDELRPIYSDLGKSIDDL